MVLFFPHKVKEVEWVQRVSAIVGEAEGDEAGHAVIVVRRRHGSSHGCIFA